MYACLLLQMRLHMNLYTVAHLCLVNIFGMISFGGLLSEELPCFTQAGRDNLQKQIDTNAANGDKSSDELREMIRHAIIFVIV